MEEADLILLILDAHRGLTEDDIHLIKEVPPAKTIVVWNKIDLPGGLLPPLDFREIVKISAKEKLGLEALYQAVDRVIWTEGPPSKEEVVISHIRHKEALHSSIDASRRVQTGLKAGYSPEFLTLDIRQSLHELGKVIGTNVSEDILSAIFSKFCIGK